MNTEKQYKVVDGTYFPAGTSDKLICTLADVALRGTRVAFVYAWDPKPEYGYVKRSSGPRKVPIRVFNARSRGGDVISIESIVEIRESRGGKVIYHA
jgi:hypothetical protein